MARQRKTPSDRTERKDDVSQQAIVFDDAHISDHVEFSAEAARKRPSGNRIIVPRGGTPSPREEEPERVFQTVEPMEDVLEWEEGDGDAERREAGSGKRIALTATVLFVSVLLAGAYGYLFGLPSFLERLTPTRWQESRTPLFSGNRAVVQLQPFFFPHGTKNAGKSGLVFLEMVVNSSLRRSMEEQLPAVRGIIYSSLRKNEKEGPPTKEIFRTISEQVNRSLGLDVVVEVRARKLS